MPIILSKDGDISMRLFDIRNKYNLSQKEASSILNTSLRTYIRYEKDDN